MIAAAKQPIYSSALRHLPLPLLIEPVEMDAALQRLISTPVPRLAVVAPPVVSPNDAAWLWLDASPNALEVTEHSLPDDLSFDQFHELLASFH